MSNKPRQSRRKATNVSYGKSSKHGRNVPYWDSEEHTEALLRSKEAKQQRLMEEYKARMDKVWEGKRMTDEERDFTNLIINSSTWSFSRLDSFDQCPYGWKCHYIDGQESAPNFFAQYGSLVHSLLERWEKGELDIFTLVPTYEEEFDKVVTCEAPRKKTGDMRSEYYRKGLDYLSSLTDELDDIKILGVEEEVHFEILDKPFVGYIDLRYLDKNGNMVIQDQKSSSCQLKKDGTPRKQYTKKMQHYAYQTYLYSIPFVEKGEKISKLRWNFFKEGFHYEIPWTEEGYHEAIKWAEDTLKTIESTDEFLPNPDFYYCNWLCDSRYGCPYRLA